MEIDRVEVIPLSYATDDVPPRRRYFAVVKVTTDEGVVGWGEAGDSFGHSTPMTLKALMEEKIQWVLLGQDPIRDEELMSRVRQDVYRYGGFRELTMQALSAVDIALWDIRGKVLDRSISDLLGRHRDRVELYASGKPAFDVPTDYHVEFNRPLLERGVGAVKVRIGNDFDWDARFVREARDLFGDDVWLAVDGKYNYTTESAIRMSQLLGELEISYFEEPLPDHNLDEIARVAAASPVPIAYGEHCFTVHDFRELVQHGAARILQPDPAICGGISEAMEVASMGTALGTPVIPHCAGMTAIGLAAGVHFAAAMPDFTLFEWDSSPVQPLRDTLPTEPLFSTERVEDGCIPVPNGPGLGVEIREEVFAEHPYELDETIAGSFPRYGTPHI